MPLPMRLLFLSATEPEPSGNWLPQLPELAVSSQDNLGGFSSYSESEKLSSLQYLVDEGFIEFEERDGEWFVKIAENVV